MDIETKIKMLKDNIAFYENFLEYDWYCQKKVKELEEEIERLTRIKDKRYIR